MARSTTRPLSVAIMALGGQGGGVMAEWTVRTGELAGFRAQYTSVQGVAQRTGATIYYIEFFPEAEIARIGKEPVLALMPVPGDVDVVVASELMEAGRAIMRGFVTPDKTTLIGSSHRVYAISEKIAMADGRAAGQAVHEAARAQARQWICFDLEQTALEGGSVISAAMFGALAGSNALPFPRSVYEEVIRESGKAVEANLRTFALAFDRARGERLPDPPAMPAAPVPAGAPPSVQPLLARIEPGLPFIAHDFALAGLRRVVDYQDPDYGRLYLDRLERLAALDRAAGGSAQRHELLREAARYLALWMTFEDPARVAELKTRSTRFTRLRDEIGAEPDQIVEVREFMHPRLAELADSLPGPLGTWTARQHWLDHFFQTGRQVRTSGLRGFLLLRLVAQARRWRRVSPRYLREDAAIEQWLARIEDAAQIDYRLAVELARCQKLVRGYGDTHERGTRNFALLMDAYDAGKGEPGFAARLKMLREAALADDRGEALRQALAQPRGAASV